MARLRFVAAALLALAFAGNSTQLGRTQEDPLVGVQTTEPKRAADEPCVIYSLTDMGFDSLLGVWIAETIPEMIEPSSWKNQGGMGAIRYYAQKNILIVKQSHAIQKKVDGFLKDLKASMPTASAANSAGKKTPHASVIPADHREPALLRTSNLTSESSGYPVAAPVKAPKHLFHFIIRYEGEGIIDDSVVKAMKAYTQAEKKASEAAAPAYTAPVTPAGTTSTFTATGSTSSSAAPATKDNKEEKKEDKKDKEKPKEKTDEP